MKKLLVAAALCASSMFAFGEESDLVQADVYNFKMTLKFPELVNGVRRQTTRNFKGTLTLEYGEGVGRPFTAAYANVLAKHTRAVHDMVFFGDSGAVLINRKNATSSYATPAVWFEGKDVRVTSAFNCAIGDPAYGPVDVEFDNCDLEHEDIVAHESFKRIILAGFGKMKTSTTAAAGCSACGVKTPMTSCSSMRGLKGSVVAIVNCECPQELDWYHTVKAGLCGIMTYNVDGELADLTEYRTNTASANGKWTATFKESTMVKPLAIEDESANEEDYE